MITIIMGIITIMTMPTANRAPVAGMTTSIRSCRFGKHCLA